MTPFCFDTQRKHILNTSSGYFTLSHVTPSSVYNINVANAIYKFLSENDLCDNIQVVGCDAWKNFYIDLYSE